MINQEIKKIRISKGLSQKEMADLLFMSQASYSKIESGKTAISLDTILKILEVYKEEASNILSTYGLKITQQAGKNEKEASSNSYGSSDDGGLRAGTGNGSRKSIKVS